MMAIGSVMTFCMNKILVVFTSTAVAVFGVYFKSAELCIYANIWYEQWNGSYNSFLIMGPRETELYRHLSLQ